MQVLEISERRFLLRLERGDEVMESLRRFAEERAIGAGMLRGLGAALSAELAFFNLKEKRYEPFSVREDTEVVSLLGNLARGEDRQAIAHVHATLSRRDGTAVAGHVLKLVTGATLEIDLEVLPGTLRRKRDPKSTLPLLHSHE
ncbi:MAG: PPC domain-containing DNA-binding protein [Terriglobia bacterium]